MDLQCSYNTDSFLAPPALLLYVVTLYKAAEQACGVAGVPAL